MFKPLHLALVALLGLAALLLSSCVPVIGSMAGIRGSGKPATREYPVDGFNTVEVDSAFQAAITNGDGYKVAVTIDDNLLDYVRVTKTGNTLRISMDANAPQGFSTTRQQASITMPQLQGVRLNGASRANIAGFGMAPAFEGNLDGASQLGGSVQAKDIRLRANGASQYNLSGQGTALTVSADGASQALLDKLAVDQAKVSLNGASQAAVNARSSLDYDIDGASHLRYSGNPTVGTARSEGASSATRQ